MKKYKTNTGLYKESELAIVVWRNPKTKTSRQSRFLETMMSEKSSFPMAFPIALLTSNKNWGRATVIRQGEDLFLKIADTDKNNPLIIPLPIAESALGWEDFYIPSEYSL